MKEKYRFISINLKGSKGDLLLHHGNGRQHLLNDPRLGALRPSPAPAGPPQKLDSAIAAITVLHGLPHEPTEPTTFNGATRTCSEDLQRIDGMTLKLLKDG
jgi:hypothetical protein